MQFMLLACCSYISASIVQSKSPVRYSVYIAVKNSKLSGLYHSILITQYQLIIIVRQSLQLRNLYCHRKTLTLCSLIYCLQVTTVSKYFV